MDIFIGTIDEKGNIVLKDHDIVRPLLLQKRGKEIQIQLRDADKRRSAKQNRWYWGVAIRTIREHLRETEGEDYAPEDIHQYIKNNVMKAKFKTKEVLGQTVTYIEAKSTSAMTTKEFETFKFELQVFFARKGIDIPDPVKNSYLNEYGIKSQT
jgi:hypothetical protein